MYLQALDQQAELRLDSAIVLFREAARADRNMYAAHDRYIGLMRSAGRAEELARDYPRDAGDALGACLAIVARAPSAYTGIMAFDLLKARARHGAHPCFETALAGTAAVHAPPGKVPGLELEYAAAASRYAPLRPTSWILHAAALRALGRNDEARAILDSALTLLRHPLLRMPIYFEAIAFHRARGDTASAERLALALRAAVRRDPRPGIEAAYLENLMSYPERRDGPNAWLLRSRRHVALARRARAWPLESSVLIGRGSILHDAGQVNAAIAAFDSALLAIPPARVAAVSPPILWRRGRSLAKAGRLADAERDLRMAIAALSTRNEAYLSAEVHHSLAHVYESWGRWVEAIAQADSFIASAEPMRTDAMRLMSRRDAGIIRWKAGQHAAARVAFDSMVAVVDERRQNYYYAAEYFERVGQLQRAAEYYHRGAATDSYERSLNLAGLTRVYEALGLSDSARIAATEHDRVIQARSETPLLPTLLAREGRVSEALALLRQWSSMQRADGNVEGQSRTALAVTRVLLDAQRPADALTEATSAARLAAPINLVADLIEAERLRGLAHFALGEHDQALRSLRAAARNARRHPSSDATIRVQLALGEVYSAVGRWREALAAFSVAAGATDSVSNSFEIDVNRARFHHTHLRAFDGALRVLLPRASQRGIADSILEWSARRKAAIATVPNAAKSRGEAGRKRLRLAVDEAMLDYFALDGRLWVIVARQAKLDIVPIAASEDSVSRLVRTLRAPLLATYAGTLDLARAPFNLSISHALYTALIAPVLPLIQDAERLAIVPDGALHYVPFDALVMERPRRLAGDGAYVDAEFMVDRFAITMVAPAFSSGRAVEEAPRRSVLVVAHGVPGAQNEAAGIRQNWVGDISVLSGERATERALWREAGQHSILHFATHAQANDADPLASYLALAGGDGSEGLLHSGEIAQARWRGRLVILSACETANGPLLAGQGLMGLARGFLAGGADAVVATLWPVGAASAEMMGPLYSALSRQAPSSVALRDAKLTLRRRSATAHPFYWAGFQLISRGLATR